MDRVENLNDDQINRYSRQILLKNVGVKGTKKLLNSTICIIGAGGLGCPAAQVLASVGVGKIIICDGDVVELSNLHRQPLHYTKDVGKPKVESVKEKILLMNPDIEVETFNGFVVKENAEEIIRKSDFIIEASDNPATKFLINDICVHLNKPFTVAGVVQYFGQILTVIPGETTCYRCIYNSNYEKDEVNSCSGAGVMGNIPSFAANLQANEAIKYILGLPMSFTNCMFAFDLLKGKFDTIKIKKNSNCKACSDPSIPFYKKENYI